MKTSLLLGSALLLVAGAAQAGEPQATHMAQGFGGISLSPDSLYGEAGAVGAIDGTIAEDGFLARGKVYGGRYDYDRTVGATNVNEDVNYYGGELMAGYQHFFEQNVRISGYVGPHVERHNNDSDPNAKLDGTEFGIKGQAEIKGDFTTDFFGFAMGNYSTVYDNYYTMAKVGYRVDPMVSFGPEVAALGNERFDAVRGGVFASFAVTNDVTLNASGGYNWDRRNDRLNDNDGAYGTGYVTVNF